VRRFLLATTAALATSAASAAEFPKSGQAEFDTYGTWRNLATFETPVGRAGMDEGHGVMRNVKGEGPFNDVVMRCLEHWTLVRDAWAGNGSCGLVDRDGDTLMTTWTSADRTFTFVGGIGKYQGITGGGTFKPDLLHDAVGGQSATIVRHVVKWEIK
jgi:hypothetical protein